MSKSKRPVHPAQKELLFEHTTARNTLPEKIQRLVIRASAGTGKTFQLTNRYLTLMRMSPLEGILASTFTRKAAGEILERILLRLANAALDKKELDELKPFLGDPEFTQHECERLLQEFTRNLHRVRISTLDGFFSRLAGSFSLELGLPPGWGILEGLDAEELKSRAIETILSGGPAQDVVRLMHLLDKGDTSRSVFQLISQKVDSFYDAFLNSEEPAWDKFPEVHFLSTEEKDQYIEQIAAFPLDGKNMTKARDKDVEALRAENWHATLEAGLLIPAAHGATYSRQAIPDQLAELYRRLYQHIQAGVITPWAEQTKATYQLLKKFHTVNERLKYETKGMMFNDVTRKLAEAMQGRTTSQLAFRMDGNIDHILLDEFQDTSPLQWKAIRPFADKACRTIDGSFFCVGDVKQAIYGWRGGEAAIFDEIETELPAINTEELNRSFRSSPVIMDAVNRIFTGMSQHNSMEELTTTLQEWSHNFPKHQTTKSDLPGYVKVVTSPLPEGYELDGKNSGPVVEELLDYTAKYVAELLKAAPNSTIAVLTRKNASVGQLIFLLNQLGIDASEEGGNPLTDSAAVQLVLSLMRLADHPGHTAALFHIVTSPLGSKFGLTDHSDSNSAHAFALKFRQRLMGGYGPVVHELTSTLAPYCNSRELRRLIQLSAQADNFDAAQLPLRPSRFVEFIEQRKVQEPTDSRVRVMTVHQSKGLEFDTVIAPELDEPLTRSPSYVTLSKSPTASPDFVALAHRKGDFDLLPEELQKAYSHTMSRSLEESLCLLYVILTRAIHGLHIILRPSHAKNETSKHPKTYAGLIRAALAPNFALPPEHVLFETGSEHWYREVPGKTNPMTHDPSKTAAKLEIAFAHLPQRRRVRSVAPSSIEGGQAVKLVNVLPHGNAAAQARGTLFHQWMEQIHWLEESQPADEVLLRIAREQGAQHLDIKKSIKQFRKMLLQPQILQTLSKSAYQNFAHLPYTNDVIADLAAGPIDLEVSNETAFSIIDDDRLLNGTIDRLVLISRNSQLLAAEVIDYKTDALPNEPGAIEDLIEHYRSQLQAYVKGVEIMHNLPLQRISAKLILLSLGRVETLQMS